MKRDMDLVRKILFKMEENEEEFSFSEDFPPLEIEGYSTRLIIHHMQIMAQTGLLHADRREYTANSMGKAQRPYVSIFYSISWQGHEFLSALRDDTRWNDVKKVMTRAGGFVTEVALDIAKEMVRQAAIKIIAP